MSLILVVEDDSAILRGLRDNLRREGYDVLTAEDGEAGYQLAIENKLDLVLLDLMLPGMSGLEVCRKLRAEGFTPPIIILTARGEESDRVLGLDLGADDYVTKPFSVRELMARVRAFLRRSQTALPDEVRFDDVVVDFRRYRATRRDNPIEMTRKEFALLRALAAKPDQAVSREDLLSDVWGFGNAPSTRTVDTHIGSLRAKIEKNPSEPRHLITIHGVGYKFIIS